MRPRFFVVVVLFALSLALDQVTKYFVHVGFHLYERVVVIPDFLNITLVTNEGTAFGLFNALGPKTLFVISIVALVVMLFVYVRHSLRNVEVAYGLALVAGGAIGNQFDRVRLGYVIDFIDFHYYDRFVWPTFNFADVVICIGVALMLFGLLRRTVEQGAKVEEKAG